MSNDSVTTTTSQSWFSRLTGAIAGVVIGIILFFVAFPLLTWNEGRAIKRIKTLEAGRGLAVSVPVTPIMPDNEGKLVHLTGDLAAGTPIMDEKFGLSEPVIRLRRLVEMYQWTEDSKQETKKKLGGSEETVTTYTYKRAWSSSSIDSSKFNSPEGHANPDQWPVDGGTFSADPVTVGAFTVPPRMVDSLSNFRPVPLKADDVAAIPTEFASPIKFSSGSFYLGNNPSAPAVGDVKISFEAVDPGPVTIVARQVKDTFEPYEVRGLGSIELLKTGTFSMEGMFAAAEQENTFITWLIRIGGFFMMFFGIILVLNPISVFADVIPFLGSLLGAGIGVIAFFGAASLSIVTIALAWLVFRPLIGIPLFVVAVASVYFGIRTIAKRRAAKAAPAAA